MSTHTIGEVLNRLKGEFDDVTISKIRFLESEGLISPDRTESGYRKFTEDDIERLRYVLRAQRDRYLPLKVIKQELARRDAGLPVDDGAAGTGAPTDAVSTRPTDRPTDGDGPGHPTSTAVTLLASSPSDVTLTRDELADASGLTAADVDQLCDHGLVPDGSSFDGDALRIAKLAAKLLANGLEIRHLRMYRQFAEREASLAEALVGPLLRQRNPDSRRAATERAEDLASVGGELHRVLLAGQLRALLRS